MKFLMLALAACAVGIFTQDAEAKAKHAKSVTHRKPASDRGPLEELGAVGKLRKNGNGDYQLEQPGGPIAQFEGSAQRTILNHVNDHAKGALSGGDCFEVNGKGTTGKDSKIFTSIETIDPADACY